MRRTSSVALFMAFTVISAVIPGCNIVGPAAYIIEGPPSIEAQHKLADVPTVVFIDDRRNVVGVQAQSLRPLIGNKASEDLMVKKLLTTTISPHDALTIASQRERNSQLLSIEDIGKAVGAQQVIYVEMLQFDDTPDRFTPRPTATCQVRVIDVEQRQRVFPAPGSTESARLVRVMTREVDPALYSTRSGRLKVFEALALETGGEIAKLFYKHERKELGGSLNPR